MMAKPAASPRPMETTESSERPPARDEHLPLRVWIRLLSCATQLENEVRRRLWAEFRISLARFDYLAQLDRHPEGLTMGELSACLMVTGANVTGLTTELEREGLVKREVAAHDRRSYHVKLTAKGRRTFDNIAASHEAWVTEILGGLGDAELAGLQGSLDTLRTRLAAVLTSSG
jgi:DNA-binding MarR family transcriptional regulator